MTTYLALIFLKNSGPTHALSPWFGTYVMSTYTCDDFLPVIILIYIPANRLIVINRFPLTLGSFFDCRFPKLILACARVLFTSRRHKKFLKIFLYSIKEHNYILIATTSTHFAEQLAPICRKYIYH